MEHRPTHGRTLVGPCNHGTFFLTLPLGHSYDHAIAHPGDCGLRTIAVCNLKGGVGKTTTTVNLGASLARNGKRVLLVDCDPQGSLTSWLRSEPENGEATLYEILRGQATVRSAATPTRWPNLSVVPSSPKLHEIDRGALAGERVLWARMSEDYDYALFDCSASPGVVLSNAITAADEVVAPVQAKGMALPGIARLRELIGEISQRGSKEIELSGILICLFDGRTRISKVVLGQLRAKYAGLVFDTVVHENVKLAEAADKRRPITDYAPTSRGAAEYAAIAFELMTREFRAATLPAAISIGPSYRERPGAARTVAHPAATSAVAAPHSAAASGNGSARPAAASAHHSLPRSTPLGRE